MQPFPLCVTRHRAAPTEPDRSARRVEASGRLLLVRPDPDGAIEVELDRGVGRTRPRRQRSAGRSSPSASSREEGAHSSTSSSRLCPYESKERRRCRRCIATVARAGERRPPLEENSGAPATTCPPHRIDIEQQHDTTPACARLEPRRIHVDQATIRARVNDLDAGSSWRFQPRPLEPDMLLQRRSQRAPCAWWRAQLRCSEASPRNFGPQSSLRSFAYTVSRRPVVHWSQDLASAASAAAMAASPWRWIERASQGRPSARGRHGSWAMADGRSCARRRRVRRSLLDTATDRRCR